MTLRDLNKSGQRGESSRFILKSDDKADDLVESECLLFGWYIIILHSYIQIIKH